MFSGRSSNFMRLGVILIIAGAVYLFITFGMKKSGFEQLLRQGDYTVEEIEVTKHADKLGAIYWPCCAAVYLGISFLTGRWDITWIMWPVVALIFTGISHAIKREKNR